ncbi:TRAP transporter small permease [Stappia sp. ES.058]|uniref:TRAP transporter small permease n=1 Tax=Stappia sp. ES.058 TaxID=1881061 RepID=UPI000879FB73|nr:TRAP transporter small permease [Stappia sp. ES.058]SDT91151.1 TRAP-type C4-dicarboxylate transport system, small permease component [Stappia sp. ES.058]
MLRIIDGASRFAGLIAGWGYFLIALMLGYEVLMRYLGDPTIWAEELSRMFLIWATFGGAALLLHRRQHIVITLLTDSLSPGARRAQELFVLAFIIALSAVVVYYGADIALDSFTRGRTTGSMLDVPAWWSQASIPACFTLLGIQAFAEAVRVALNGVDTARPTRIDH